MDPLRGEVWDARLPVVGEHPVVVLTVNPLVARLSSVSVVVVTGTEGPASTHVRLDKDSGLSKYPVSFANATDLHTVAKASLRRRRGMLHAAEIARLEDALRLSLGL